MTRRSTAAAVTLFLFFAGVAQATIISGTFTGKIAGNTSDTYGLFGTMGANLSGATFSAAYSYDTSMAFLYLAQSTYDAYLCTGGLTLSVTIGANVVATAGVTGFEIIDTQDGTDTEVTLANFAPTPLIEFTLFAEGAWASGVTINAPVMLDPTYFQQAIDVSANGSDYDVLNFVGSSEFDTALNTPAPEPASLALLGAGLAGILCVRRRQRSAFLARSHASDGGLPPR